MESNDMATATLQKPLNSLSAYGVRFMQGIPELVSYDVGRALKGNPRFKVLFDELEATSENGEPVKTGKPKDRASIMIAIREAIDRLDPNDETVWTSNGAPDARALTSVLGWQVTSAERDDALKQAAAPIPRQLGRVKVVRRNPPIDTGLERGDMDRSTLGAVSV